MQHIKDINATLDRMKGFHLATKKCLFFQKKIDYLGFEVSEKGIAPGKKNVEKLLQAEIKTVKHIRTFLGMAGFYRKWISDYAGITSELVATTKKNYRLPDKKLTPGMEKAIEILKEKLTTYPILRHPDFNRHFFLETDASKRSLGAICFQKDDDGRRYVIGYASTAIKDKDQKLPAHEKECMAAAFGMNYFRHMLISKRFTLLADASILQYLKKRQPLGANWQGTWSTLGILTMI